MKRTVAIVTCSMALAASFATVRAQQPPSVLGGVFTADQAKRGEKVYIDSCSACHGVSLAGDLGSEGEIEVKLPARYNLDAHLRGWLKTVPGVLYFEDV